MKRVKTGPALRTAGTPRPTARRRMAADPVRPTRSSIRWDVAQVRHTARAIAPAL